MKNNSLRVLGSLAALIGLVGLLAAMPASAAKLSGKTILAPNSETLDALASLGVEVDPTARRRSAATASSSRSSAASSTRRPAPPRPSTRAGSRSAAWTPS